MSVTNNDRSIKAALRQNLITASIHFTLILDFVVILFMFMFVNFLLLFSDIRGVLSLM